MNETEIKGLVNDLVENISKLLRITIKKKESDAMVKQFYLMGHDEIELQFNLNIKQNSKELTFLKDYTFENIKNFNNEMKDKLRKELSMGLLNNENQTQMIKRVNNILKISKNRASMIIRTETNRIFNSGRQTAAENSDLKLVKEWSAHIDSRTSPICRFLNNKRVKLNQKFDYQGQKFDTAPAHVNCRSRVLYVPI